MAVTLTQNIYQLRPMDGSPNPPGTKVMVFGQATLASGTVEVAVPFGGSEVDVALGNLDKASSSSAISVESDRTIDSSTHKVTFNSSSTTSTADINYLMIGTMGETAAS